MQEAANEIRTFVRAVAFAAEKHRHQRRKDAEASPCINHPSTAIVREVTDDKSLSKSLRRERQVEHAPHLSRHATLVKLADKICNLRDILAHPPAGWADQRKTEYFEWAGRVVYGLRGTHSGREKVFDELVAYNTELVDPADIR
jgi:guanosine-3',5'-bis(diphosphate) 3'-pyrophosphohydrolase